MTCDLRSLYFCVFLNWLIEYEAIELYTLKKMCPIRVSQSKMAKPRNNVINQKEAIKHARSGGN